MKDGSQYESIMNHSDSFYINSLITMYYPIMDIIRRICFDKEEIIELIQDEERLMSHPKIIAYYRSLEPTIFNVILSSYTRVCHDNVPFKSYKDAKNTFHRIFKGRYNRVREFEKSKYIISQKNGKYWVVLSKILNCDNLFDIDIYSKEDEVKGKYSEKLKKCFNTMYDIYQRELQIDSTVVPEIKDICYPLYPHNIRNECILKIVMKIVGGDRQKAHMMIDDIGTLMKQPEIIQHYRAKDERLEKSRLFGIIPMTYELKKKLFIRFSNWKVAENALYIGADTKYCPAYSYSDSTKSVYIVSKKKGKYWFVINSCLNDDTLFEVSIYASKHDINDEKYSAKLERCVALMYKNLN